MFLVELDITLNRLFIFKIHYRGDQFRLQQFFRVDTLDCNTFSGGHIRVQHFSGGHIRLQHFSDGHIRVQHFSSGHIRLQHFSCGHNRLQQNSWVDMTDFNMKSQVDKTDFNTFHVKSYECVEVCCVHFKNVAV